MKIRLLDDSIRIRIQQKELESLHRTGRVEAETTFGPAQRLVYSVQAEDLPTPLRANFVQSSIHIEISRAHIDELVETDLVGVSFEQPAGADKSLHILLEKDFKCLTPRPGEEDAFPNPNEVC